MKPLDMFGKTNTQSGLVIDELEMRGFMRYVDKTIIKIPEKFTVITGKTGSGKSTILDAITFALYRRTSRTELRGVGVKLEDVCQRSGYVRLVFSQGGARYEVARGIRDTGKSYLSLKADGKSISGDIVELDSKIKEIIGLDYEGFVNSTFVRQEEMKALGSATGAQRLEIFQKLFRLEIFGKAQEIAKEKLVSLQSEIDVIEGELTAMKDQINKELPVKHSALTAEAEEVKKLSAKLAELELNIHGKKKEHLELAKKHDEYISTLAKLEEIEKAILESERKIEKLSENEKEFTALKQKVSEYENKTKDLEILRKELEELKDTYGKVSMLQIEKSGLEKALARLDTEYEADIRRLEQEIEAQEKRTKTLHPDIDKEKAFQMLRTEGSLGERIARIEKELTWNLESQLKKELVKEQEGARKDLIKVSKDVAKISIDYIALLSEIQTNIEKIKKELERKGLEHKRRRAEIETDIENLQKSISSYGFGEVQLKRMKFLDVEIKEKQQIKTLLDTGREKIQQLGDIPKQILELRSQKDNNATEKNKLHMLLKQQAAFELRYQNVGEELEKAGKEKSELEKTASMKEGRCAALKEDIHKLEKLGEAVIEKEKEESKLKEHAEIFTILRDHVFHKKGIAMYAVNQLLSSLTKEVSDNLSDLTAGRFTCVHMPIYEEGDRYGIRIEVLGVDGKWHDAQEFSGGEKTQINAALRFAIAKELAMLPQVGKTYGRMKTLFIDEGDLGSLDTEISRELFVRKLFSMEKFFDKVILITHLTDIAERFPAKIQIGMTEDGVSRVE